MEKPEARSVRVVLDFVRGIPILCQRAGPSQTISKLFWIILSDVLVLSPEARW